MLQLLSMGDVETVKGVGLHLDRDGSVVGGVEILRDFAVHDGHGDDALMDLAAVYLNAWEFLTDKGAGVSSRLVDKTGGIDRFRGVDSLLSHGFVEGEIDRDVCYCTDGVQLALDKENLGFKELLGHNVCPLSQGVDAMQLGDLLLAVHDDLLALFPVHLENCRSSPPHYKCKF